MAKFHLNLIQDGYVIIDKELSKNEFLSTIEDVYITKPSSHNFISYSSRIKYVCVCDIAQICLLSSNAVFMKIPYELSHQADSLFFNSTEEIEGVSVVKFPLIDRVPCRKFFYSGILSEPEKANCQALKIFQRVLQNSKGLEIQLKPNECLIFDNHRMLHRINN